MQSRLIVLMCAALPLLMGQQGCDPTSLSNLFLQSLTTGLIWTFAQMLTHAILGPY
jgi:hypothetical protein